MKRKLSLLVVDDDVNFGKTLSKVLSVKGYEVVRKESGPEALEEMNKRTFDVVLMDIKMPVMDGIEASRRIKEKWADTVVIIMTAFSVDEMVKDAIRDGVYSVLHKPLDMDKVINMIEISQNGAFLTVVDEDIDHCKAMKEFLESNGYSVTICKSGDEAIEIAKNRSSDVLFIEVNLPILNGIETYLEIKAINPEIVLVVMTAHGNDVKALVETAMEKGAYACLYKPFNMDDALTIIEKIKNEKLKKDLRHSQ